MTALATTGLASVDALEPISLEEMNAHAALMTRVDRKYFVPRPVFERIVTAAADEFRVLQIGEDRIFRYRTVYFDSPEFAFFRQHAQGRRHRFKVRTRTYCESGDCMLEVKSKGYRGQTVKKRIAHDPEQADALDARSGAFVESLTGVDASRLQPVLETIYRRMTLTHGDQRVTCDIDLECVRGHTTHSGPDDVLVETKSSLSPGPFDMALREAGVRPHSVSKYAVAASLLYPHLPSNRWHRTMRRHFGW